MYKFLRKIWFDIEKKKIIWSGFEQMNIFSHWLLIKIQIKTQSAGVILTQINWPAKNSGCLWSAPGDAKQFDLLYNLYILWFEQSFNEHIINILETCSGKMCFWKFYVTDSMAD